MRCTAHIAHRVRRTLGWSGLGVAEAAGECGQQLLGQRGDLVEHGGEARLVEDVQAAVAEGADRRRSRTTVEQGEFAEVVAPLQLGGDLAVVLDGRLAAGDDVEVVAGFALGADDLAGGDLAGFITSVMRSTSDGNRPANSGTARTNSCSSDLGATVRRYPARSAILGGW